MSKTLASYIASAAVLLLINVVVVTISLMPVNLPKDSEGFTQYAVIFYKNQDNLNKFDAISHANGYLVRSSKMSNMWVVATKDDDFISKIKEKGAFLVVSPIIRGGCFFDSRNKILKV
jgi:hypothetical protein